MKASGRLRRRLFPKLGVCFLNALEFFLTTCLAALSKVNLSLLKMRLVGLFCLGVGLNATICDRRINNNSALNGPFLVMIRMSSMDVRFKAERRMHVVGGLFLRVRISLVYGAVSLSYPYVACVVRNWLRLAPKHR